MFNIVLVLHRFGGKEELSDKDLNKVAPNIATEWKDIGIQLGIRSVDSYAQKVNLTDEKFKRMLMEWLKTNKAKTLDEILKHFMKHYMKLNRLQTLKNIGKMLKSIKRAVLKRKSTVFQIN